MKLTSKLLPLLIATNLITISLMLTGCPDPTPPDPSVDPTANCYPAATNTPEFQGLNALLVHQLAYNYRENQLKAINDRFYAGTEATESAPATNGDARSVWFDLETVKRFIYEVEMQTCNRCDNNNTKHLGIRIYYGAYPEASKWHDTASIWSTALSGVPEEFAGKHTVMFVPTYREGNNDIDFDPRYINNGCDFTALESFYTTMKTNTLSGVTFTMLSSMNVDMQNHGSLIPPPYDIETIVDKGAGIMYAVDKVEITE